MPKHSFSIRACLEGGDLVVAHGEERLRLGQAGDPPKLAEHGGNVLHAPRVRPKEALEVGTLALRRLPASRRTECRPILRRAVVCHRERLQLLVQLLLLLLCIGRGLLCEMRFLCSVVLRRLRVPCFLPRVAPSHQQGAWERAWPRTGRGGVGRVCCVSWWGVGRVSLTALPHHDL